MSIVKEIVATWRGPRAAIRRQLQAGQREDRALVYLMLGCFLIFVAQWPRLMRESLMSDAVPLEALLGAALFGWMFLAPLFFYAIAGFSHLFARMMGGSGTFYGARLALFWTVLAVSPAILAFGLVSGFLGAGAITNLIASVLTVAFAAIWLLSLAEAEKSGRV
ncbi:YIP1 family protein [Rhodovulum strictum]|uniref:YIP1 family protein n=1 Tax=Rhodovulum strictum TaxID=58314 RepID=A0A844BGF9_9RHOB|nr:YIP1 family protein [Rhodovulum strictum]MRH20162.1 YIP1 family protein [Rhodovulum strictum]